MDEVQAHAVHQGFTHLRSALASMNATFPCTDDYVTVACTSCALYQVWSVYADIVHDVLHVARESLAADRRWTVTGAAPRNHS